MKKPFAEMIIGLGKAPKKEEMSEEIDESHELAKEVLSAIESKDAMALSESLHALFQSFEVQPHEEVEHEEE